MADSAEERAELASSPREEVRLLAPEATELASEAIEVRTEVTKELAPDRTDEAVSATVEVTSLSSSPPVEEGETLVALATAEVRMGSASGVPEAVAATPAQRA